ncbi:MAG: response regulator, partial [Deltaproteobacteria bacterium]|nr:response regulator [Deltaproteobacteria bacterium]
FNLRNCVENIVESIAQRASQKDLETACLIESDVPLFLRGDPGRLRQVLLNLMGNAIKFTEKGEVTTRVRLERDEKDAAILRFEVADTGIGIPPERASAIFDAFSQADGSTTRKYGGTGLGLAISKQLVEMLGGEIAVQSIEGKGSTFSFSARFIKDAEARVSKPSTEEPVDIRNTRILIVDDNETNRLVCTTMLEPFGCRMASVNSGFEALDALREAVKDEDPFKLVLLDQMMPEMSGEQTAREIKADPMVRETILIMLTSLGNRGDIKRLKDVGIRGYLVKPIKQDQLHKAVVTAIGQKIDESGEISPMITKYSIAEANFDDTRILLVEDHIINQKVAAKILQKWDLKVIVAENGQKAIDALKTSTFDLVLMDIQMPVMDGLTATAKIREMERDTGEHIPIIAMTANAMKGDREKYLEAGMDDFVPKPIVKEALFNALKKWLKGENKETHEAGRTEPVNGPSIAESEPMPASSGNGFDLSPVLTKFGDDMAFFRELAEIFINDTPERIKALEHSLKNKDAKEVESLAHKLKGVSGNFGIDGLYNLFSELQELGKER